MDALPTARLKLDTSVDLRSLIKSKAEIFTRPQLAMVKESKLSLLLELFVRPKIITPSFLILLPRELQEKKEESRSAGGKDGQMNKVMCGNGVRESGEQCDDGNVINGDGKIIVF